MSVLYSDVGRFTMTPEWLLDANVSDRAVRLFALLGTYADRDTGEAFPGRKLLASRLRCSMDTVDRAIDELVTIGALVVERRTREDGSQASNLYRLQFTRPGGAAPVPRGGAAPVPRQELEPLELDTTADAVVPRARDRQLVRWHVDKVAVTEDEDMLARAVLAEWNVQTGQRLASKSWLSMIVMRVREHPELSIRDHGQLIASTLADPWWKGAPAPNVVYGNDRVFERSLTPNATGPRKRPRVYGYGVTPGEILDVTRGKR